MLKEIVRWLNAPRFAGRTGRRNAIVAYVVALGLLGVAASCRALVEEDIATEALMATAPATGGTAGTTGITTDPNLKVAFIGDTNTGTNFRSVLGLIRNEHAAAVVVQGDMSYSGSPETWWSDVESVLGTTFPVFISRGNHDDSSWSGYLPKAAQHLGGAVREPGAHHLHRHPSAAQDRVVVLAVGHLPRLDELPMHRAELEPAQHVGRLVERRVVARE